MVIGHRFVGSALVVDYQDGSCCPVLSEHDCLYFINLGAQAQREATYAPPDVIMDIEFGDLDPLQILKDAAS